MDKIMVVDNIEDIVEDGEVIGKLVTDKAGNKLKVKIGQGGHLKKKWDELIIGRAYKFIMGEFKGFPFVQDFEEVKSILEKEAAETITKKMVDNRDRSMATSYGKDLLCAGKIEKHELLDWIELFYKAITGQIGGSDEGVMSILRQIVPDEVAQAYKEAKATIKGEGAICPFPSLTEIVPIENGVALAVPATEFEALAIKKFKKDATVISWLRMAFDPTIAKDVDWRQFFISLPQDKQEDLLAKLKKHATTPASVKL